jgi:predicted porin
MGQFASFAVATAFTLSATAYAQNSVTLYGSVDTGIAYLHNSEGQSSQWRMSSSNLAPNTFGLKGTEDLGDGLNGIFQLENGFDLGTGAISNDLLFGRMAIIGLSGVQFGRVTMGRQFDPVTDLVQPITGDQYSGTFAPPGDVDNFDDSAWFNNTVKWTSPAWSGFTLEAMYALGGIAGSVGSGQTWSAAAGYNAGPLNLAAGFLHTDNGNATLSTRGTSTANSFFNSAVNNAYATARGINIARVGGQYVIGKVIAAVAYSYTEYTPDSASSFTDSQHFNNGSVFISWMATPKFQVVGGYNYTRSGGDSSATYHQANIGIDYFLSKRTDFYATAGYQHASGENGAGPAQAVIGSYDVDSDARSQILAIVGIRQLF